jgi:hypothetical protein
MAGQNPEVRDMAKKRTESEIKAELQEWRGHHEALSAGLPVAAGKIDELEKELEECQQAAKAVDAGTVKAIAARDGVAAGVLAIREAGGESIGTTIARGRRR